MGKRKQNLTPAEMAEKQSRQPEYRTAFVNGNEPEDIAEELALAARLRAEPGPFKRRNAAPNLAMLMLVKVISDMLNGPGQGVAK